MPFMKKKKVKRPRRAGEDDRRFKRKSCRFCADKVFVFDYKDANRLRNFISDRGKIVPRRITGNCTWCQHQLAQAIKRSRSMGLLPFVAG
ncbi:MAG TPA: 30S ribosomal protein S18 [bacterium]|jgi:small subunit ribosomal protein S18|nr:30S ribosomal protein S18 [bacterium]